MLSNYLRDRKQHVQIGDCISDFVIIVLGVPQGSVLGPLLFLSFINDMPYALSDFKSILFEDDTTLHLSDHNMDSLMINFKRSIVALLDWSAQRRLVSEPTGVRTPPPPSYLCDATKYCFFIVNLIGYLL